MENYVQAGDVVTLIAPSGGVVSGGVYQIGQLLVVAATTADENAEFEGKTTGVFTVTKTGSQAWTVGAVVYWTGTAFTTSASGNFRAGCAMVATGSGSGETTGVVRLNGVALPDES